MIDIRLSVTVGRSINDRIRTEATSAGLRRIDTKFAMRRDHADYRRNDKDRIPR